MPGQGADYQAEAIGAVVISSLVVIAPRFPTPVCTAGTRYGGGKGHAHATVCGNCVVGGRLEGDGCAAAAHYPGVPRAVIARRRHAAAEDGQVRPRPCETDAADGVRRVLD